MPSRSNFRLAIQVLTNKRDEYHRTVIDGRYRYHDPEDQIRVYESMRDSLSETIAFLIVEQEKCGTPV